MITLSKSKHNKCQITIFITSNFFSFCQFVLKHFTLLYIANTPSVNIRPNKVARICSIKIVNNFACLNFDYIYVYLLVNLAVEEYDIFPASILNACIKFRNLI
jgi:hypothetical protein